MCLVNPHSIIFKVLSEHFESNPSFVVQCKSASPIFLLLFAFAFRWIPCQPSFITNPFFIYLTSWIRVKCHYLVFLKWLFQFLEHFFIVLSSKINYTSKLFYIRFEHRIYPTISMPWLCSSVVKAILISRRNWDGIFVLRCATTPWFPFFLYHPQA